MARLSSNFFFCNRLDVLTVQSFWEFCHFSITCSILCWNSSLEIPWIWSFSHSVSVTLFQTYFDMCLFCCLFSYRFFLQIIICIDHKPFFTAYFYFVCNSTYPVLCFCLSFIHGCLVLASGIFFNITIICTFFIILGVHFSFYSQLHFQ